MNWKYLKNKEWIASLTGVDKAIFDSEHGSAKDKAAAVRSLRAFKLSGATYRAREQLGHLSAAEREKHVAATYAIVDHILENTSSWNVAEN